MWINFALVIFALVGFSDFAEVKGSRKCSTARLNQLLEGLLRSFHYMDSHKTEMNLDGLIGVRMMADQLTVLAETISQKDFAGKQELMSRLENIANMSNHMIEQSDSFVQAYDPSYHKDHHGMYDRNSWKLRYPQRIVDRNLQSVPWPCSKVKPTDILYIGICFKEIDAHNSSQSEKCNISNTCLNFMTREIFKDYLLTHEVVYFQLAEMHGCIPTLLEMGINLPYITSLQETFCANVMRDAEEIARNNYPLSHRDLFLEQIGVCGMYGFVDFWNEEWIDEILVWQMSNGCFSAFGAKWQCQDNLKNKRITKRADRILEDGCSTHTTAVAMIALAVNIRFCAEALAAE